MRGSYPSLLLSVGSRFSAKLCASCSNCDEDMPTLLSAHAHSLCEMSKILSKSFTQTLETSKVSVDTMDHFARLHLLTRIEPCLAFLLFCEHCLHIEKRLCAL